MALYRKYRPASFAEVVGQEHVTEPLSTALDSGRINHAYLFSGPRGCGKTSSARILARSLNCVEGPTSTPCGVCDSCVALAPGGPGTLDVTELDAATHNGVDDMRELRDRAFYAPAESRYRVFIIDEAHMISSAGFNALLKIVEEPPEHLIFIFATTEPEKLLATIRSRTHNYPFRLLTPPAMRGLLEKVCGEEGVIVEDAVYPLVIRAGGGSPRDSLSIMDQLLAGAGPEGVTYTRALALLGVTDSALIDRAVDALAGHDQAALFRCVNEVIDAGYDPRRFATDLLDRFRDLLVVQAVPDAFEQGLVDAPADQRQILSEQAQDLGQATLTRCAALVNEGLEQMRGATAPRLLLEILCARMALPAAGTTVEALAQRIEALESGGVRAVPGGPGAGAGTPSLSSGKRYERRSQRQAREAAERAAREAAGAAAAGTGDGATGTGAATTGGDVDRSAATVRESPEAVQATAAGAATTAAMADGVETPAASPATSPDADATDATDTTDTTGSTGATATPDGAAGSAGADSSASPAAPATPGGAGGDDATGGVHDRVPDGAADAAEEDPTVAEARRAREIVERNRRLARGQQDTAPSSAGNSAGPGTDDTAAPGADETAGHTSASASGTDAGAGQDTPSPSTDDTAAPGGDETAGQPAAPSSQPDAAVAGDLPVGELWDRVLAELREITLSAWIAARGAKPVEATRGDDGTVTVDLRHHTGALAAFVTDADQAEAFAEAGRRAVGAPVRVRATVGGRTFQQPPQQSTGQPPGKPQAASADGDGAGAAPENTPTPDGMTGGAGSTDTGDPGSTPATPSTPDAPPAPEDTSAPDDAAPAASSSPAAAPSSPVPGEDPVSPVSAASSALERARAMERARAERMAAQAGGAAQAGSPGDGPGRTGTPGGATRGGAVGTGQGTDQGTGPLTGWRARKATIEARREYAFDQGFNGVPLPEEPPEDPWDGGGPGEPGDVAHAPAPSAGPARPGPGAGTGPATPGGPATGPDPAADPSGATGPGPDPRGRRETPEERRQREQDEMLEDRDRGGPSQYDHRTPLEIAGELIEQHLGGERTR
ncbi:DNA polymerase III subunit gamma and tau [Corynebacterium bovis]|uniref:DNA polymerase III subunit gamma/tau n=8 Tax=Corynebacterium bovis TaxID=36808 RepID=A0A3R8R5T7_9CORY|nr:DNA polymerase III subunit gamma and tau [Corynebacterium bovis]RRO93443.1 DNA polymerase III subunit gamma and tau [Corynebacterium bovis]RRQ00856.1 DNA polymerase III subunit gamma and tau [Corynebacterium bovis]RRQ04685.1 DNA polymerase III subunit gamma and tau [Corynebacterium bovis]RRQ08384.1 DNA polymerase III subunit gamma and tau [Corynebacterium bovis]RRQ09827.1 DNA polymerase III subunit gamma and tau [Corynebacterium bovis]